MAQKIVKIHASRKNNLTFCCTGKPYNYIFNNIILAKNNKKYVFYGHKIIKNIFKTAYFILNFRFLHLTAYLTAFR